MLKVSLANKLYKLTMSSDAQLVQVGQCDAVFGLRLELVSISLRASLQVLCPAVTPSDTSVNRQTQTYIP